MNRYRQTQTGFDPATLFSLINPTTQRALMDLARTPAGSQLVHGLGAQLNLPPALLAVFDHWLAGTGDVSEAEFTESETDDEPAEIAALEQELSELRNLNENLAAALGACAECWGADDACPECEGQGGAGSVRPDPELYNALVAPAVVRVNANRVRRLRLIPDSFTADSRG
ncbi:hypothetical protein QWY82_08315 [Simiduia curdlanivorans]|uniref:Uncharacterized protein n=1 Tax=Simiduia curdlanivorans TaxID=1492769 RepID=A0ABV8V6G8_9GAMM|nr:hypothetical protein [Simiduia curdlanivorans]MDN3638807.1 hypothetical protein [Simiduia curdlanivorans]